MLNYTPLHKLIQGTKGSRMKQLKGQAELDSYKLTKKEIANYLGIKPNAVRMSMRGNNYHNLKYRFDGYQYKFKVPTRPRVTIADHTPLNPGSTAQKQTTPGITPKSSKVINRGATHRGEAKYTSLALQMANEAKTMKAIDNKFVDEAHKKEFMAMTEAGFEQALKNSRVSKDQKFQKETQRSYSQDNSNVLNPKTHGKYGGMITAEGMKKIDDKEHGRLARLDDRKNGPKFKEEQVRTKDLDGSLRVEYRRTNVPDFIGADTSYYTNGRNAGASYSGFNSDKKVAVEFSQYELDNYGPVKERTEFKDKIDESIHRARRQSLSNDY